MFDELLLENKQKDYTFFLSGKTLSVHIFALPRPQEFNLNYIAAFRMYQVFRYCIQKFQGEMVPFILVW